MDTPQLKNTYLLGGLAVVAIVAIGAFVYYYSAGPPAVTEVGALEQSLEDASAPPTRVPTSVNPVKEVLPSETAFDKTNPFNDTEYANPFQ